MPGWASRRRSDRRLAVPQVRDGQAELRVLLQCTDDEKVAKETLHILLKYQTDIAKATKELTVEDK